MDTSPCHTTPPIKFTFLNSIVKGRKVYKKKNQLSRGEQANTTLWILATSWLKHHLAKRNVVRPHTLKAWSLAAAKGESTSLCHGPACHGEQKPTLRHCDQSGVSAVRVAAAQACCYFCVELGQGGQGTWWGVGWGQKRHIRMSEF